jgi:prophage DNA circulation protein
VSNIIGDLPELRWRGLRAPCESAHYKGSHTQAERRYPYVDGAGHDWTGMDPYQFQPTRLHFINTIKPGDWYPTKWNAFRAALEDGSSDDLDHPDLGAVRARVLSWDVALNAQNRGGIVVDVVWTQTIDNLDERVVFLGPDVSPAALAQACDDGMTELGIEYPDGKSETSLFELISQIDGFLFSTRLTIQGQINQAVGTVAGLIKTVNNLQDHAAWALYGNLVALWNGLKAMQQEVISTQRATRIVVTSSETTLDQIARDVGNTVDELIGLNLSLLRSPSVGKGVKVTVYSGGAGTSSPLRKPGP